MASGDVYISATGALMMTLSHVVKSGPKLGARITGSPANTSIDGLHERSLFQMLHLVRPHASQE